jgi:hypothetical protein
MSVITERQAVHPETRSRSRLLRLWVTTNWLIMWAYCYVWLAITIGLPGEHACAKIFNITIDCFAQLFLFALDKLPKMMHP